MFDIGVNCISLADCYASVLDLFQSQASVINSQEPVNDMDINTDGISEPDLSNITNNVSVSKIVTKHLEPLTFTNDTDFTDDSDSCSDYDSDLHEVLDCSGLSDMFPKQMSDPTNDSGFPRYKFVDEVAEKLDYLISEDIIPIDHIFLSSA